MLSWNLFPQRNQSIPFEFNLIQGFKSCGEYSWIPHQIIIWMASSPIANKVSVAFTVHIFIGIQSSEPPSEWPIKFCLQHFKTSLACSHKSFYLSPKKPILKAYESPRLFTAATLLLSTNFMLVTFLVVMTKYLMTATWGKMVLFGFMVRGDVWSNTMGKASQQVAPRQWECEFWTPHIWDRIQRWNRKWDKLYYTSRFAPTMTHFFQQSPTF